MRMLSMILWVWPSSSSWTMWPATWACCGQKKEHFSFCPFLVVPFWCCQTPSFTSQLLNVDFVAMKTSIYHPQMAQVIGPAQWDEDVLGIYWTLVMGSAASEKHEKEERTEAHEAWESRSHMKPPDLAGNSAIPLIWNAPQTKLWIYSFWVSLLEVFNVNLERAD